MEGEFAKVVERLARLAHPGALALKIFMTAAGRSDVVGRVAGDGECISLNMERSLMHARSVNFGMSELRDLAEFEE